MVTGYVTSALCSWCVLTFHASEECGMSECGSSIPETTDTISNPTLDNQCLAILET